MKPFPLFVAGLFLLAGCTPNAQLITLRGNNVTPTSKGLIIDNDSLTIRYSFYSERGIMTFSVFNKLTVPLYVDWKNSAFIVGSTKFDYWRDVAYVALSGPSYRYNGYPGYGLAGTVSKDDQVGFIPPQTKLTKQQFVVLPAGHLRLSGQPTIEQEPELWAFGSRKKRIDVQNYAFTAADSPCRFRNFLTLSTQRDFQQAFYIDTRFYAANVRVMPATQVSGYRTPYSNQTDAMARDPHKLPDSFYVITKASGTSQH